MRLPLNALRTFEAVASRLSFSKAADDLHVSPAAVSSQIRILEDKLDQLLFNRQGRKVTLTEAGQTLLPGVQRGFAELSQAVGSLEEERSRGVLNVTMVPSFLQKWLTPRLADFYNRYNQIDLRINADNLAVNFAETDFHAGIRFGLGQWPGLTVNKLLDDWILPVCSPELLRRIGPIASVEDLQDHHLLYIDDEFWNSWFKALGGENLQRRGPTLDDSVSIIMAAEQGAGIGLTRWSLVASELDSGRLVRPLPQVVKSDWAYFFVAPPHYFEMPKVALLRNWLEECCRIFQTPEVSSRND
jgi:LysR family glycine cleavage system transcriptional activator